MASQTTMIVAVEDELSTPTERRAIRSWVPRLCFIAAIGSGAFLLFSVQLLIGKYILPWFGGTAGVWTTCLLFFQTTLLAGYWYAHAGVSRLRIQAQSRIHIILLTFSLGLLASAAFFWPSPITPGASWKPQGGEIALWAILRLLTISVGFSVSLLATTGPLMQHWFTRVYPGESPYRLYALSNAGSLIGLLSYPLIVEPLLRLRTQAWLWCAAYMVYAVAAIACAIIVTKRASDAPPPEQETETNLRPGTSQKSLWFLLAAMGSLMLLATTHFITQDLAPIPLLWVLPLAVYLISFIVCFDHPRWYRPALFHGLLLATVLLTIVIYRGIPLHLWTFIAAFLLVLFACCMFCHGELCRRRPQSAHLTSFYLMIALGGVAGSAFVNLLAPLFFKGYWEMQLGMAACLITMAVLAVQEQDSWAHHSNLFIPVALIGWALLTTVFWFSSKSDTLTHFLSDWRFAALVVSAVICTLLAFRLRLELGIHVPPLTRWCLFSIVAAASLVLVWAGTAQYRYSNWAHRNFYGALYVQQRISPDARFNVYALRHTNIDHGVQLIAPELRRYPTSYYNKTSGVGLLLLNYPRQQEGASTTRPLRVGAIGLGIGTIATYGQAGDVFRFYEIDPEVIRVASGKYGFFSFLSDSPAHIDVVEGDARISLERELANGQPQQYDILVMDAFSSDAVPVHLLTKEAFELYLKHLRDDDSVIAVHVSNRSVELPSVIAAEADHFHLHSVFINAAGFHNDTIPDGIISPNQWMLLSRSSRLLSLPAIAKASSPLNLRHGLHFWTDDSSNLLQILR
jgi:hypothetical protein